MAEDADRAQRIAALKEQNPRLTWSKIAQEVGVSERAATRWQRTGALKPENAEALARLFDVDFDYIWTGPRPETTPEPFVDRRHQQMKQEQPVDVRLDAVEGALAQILTAMTGQLAEQTTTLQNMNTMMASMADTLDAIKGLLARDVEVRDELAAMIDRRAQEIAGDARAAESDRPREPQPTVAAAKSRAAKRRTP